MFDERMGARITDDVLTECETCGDKCDLFSNCFNYHCHVIIIESCHRHELLCAEWLLYYIPVGSIHSMHELQIQIRRLLFNGRISTELIDSLNIIPVSYDITY